MTAICLRLSFPNEKFLSMKKGKSRKFGEITSKSNYIYYVLICRDPDPMMF